MQMVFYIEACESGSMFKNLLPNNISGEWWCSYISQCLLVLVLVLGVDGLVSRNFHAPISVQCLSSLFLNVLVDGASTTCYGNATLRSAARGDLVVPRTRRCLSNRAFCVAGPTAWNNLPSDIRTASSVTTFKNLLKTHLFIQSYYSTYFSVMCFMAPL